MDFFSIILVVLGLCLFETINSIDNAIINAEVLSTMSKRARKWFLLWGLLFAVFLVRGFLPWIIIWATTPALGFWGSFTATFSNDPAVHKAIESSAPILLVGAGTFLVLLFIHWLFLEPKNYGLFHERHFAKYGVWFYAVAGITLTIITWYGMKVNPLVAFGAVIGSTVFFITNGFKQNAETSEQKLMKSGASDIAKIFYLEVIDMTFSIDGVLGAFAFTLSIPLILIGNGLGAVVVRQITVSNIDKIKKYRYLKNGAMYSILILGVIMLLDGFGMHIPTWLSPVSTFAIVGFFLWKSKAAIKQDLNPK
jgi:hypothetical protein